MISPELKEGIKGYNEIKVEHKDTANALGSGSLDVLATPAMIALMENVAMMSVNPYIDKGFTTVGVEVDVKHIKASAVGVKVWCESLLTKIEGKRLYFDVFAYDEKGMIGSAVHVRYVVDEVKFMERI